MKKQLSLFSLLSLSLILCACSSSAPAGSSGTSEGKVPAETGEVSGSSQDSDLISLDSFTISTAEKENTYGFNSTVITLTNNSSFTLLNPMIVYRLRPEVTAADLQAFMPEGVEVDTEQLEMQRDSLYPLYNIFPLGPSETSPELEIEIPVKPQDNYNFYYGCPCNQQMLDLMDLAMIRGELIVCDQLKRLYFTPDFVMPDEQGMPADALEDSHILLNQIPEEAKDLLMIPEGSSIFTTEEIRDYNNDGKHRWRFIFYNVEDASMTQYTDAVKENYPLDPLEGKVFYQGSDSGGNSVTVENDSKYHTVSVFLQKE